jgi:hypothetical protein
LYARYSTKRVPPNTTCGCGCGCIVTEYKVGGGTRYCRSKDDKFYLPKHCPSIKGELSHKWKGGRCKSSSGYIHIYHPEHPNADKDGYVLEHRYVWEQANGRLLNHNEHIHHINGVKDDNRIENLIALTKSQHMSLEVKLRGGIPTTPESVRRAGRLGAKARWG